MKPDDKTETPAWAVQAAKEIDYTTPWESPRHEHWARIIAKHGPSAAHLAEIARYREALAPFAEMAKYRTFPFHGQMQAMQANPNTSAEPGFQLFCRDFYRAADLLTPPTA